MNALHHFPNKEIFIREARRVIRSDGTLAVIGMDPHRQSDHWYIYDYFDGTRETDLRRFRQAYEAGLSRLKADLAEAENKGETLTFPEDISLVMVAGELPR